MSYLIPVDLVSKITSDLDSICEVLKIHISDDPTETRKFVNRFMDSMESATFQKNPEGAPGIFVVDSRAPLQGLQPFGFEAAENIEDILGLEDGDLVVLQARKRAPHTGGSTPLGNLRLALHSQAVAEGYLKRPEGFDFLWIVDFPLFLPTNSLDSGQGGAAGISSTHHPFTSPKAADDIDLLLTDPLAVRGDHYDLVVNGVELGGGSRRIHDARLQEFVLKDVLQVSLGVPTMQQTPSNARPSKLRRGADESVPLKRVLASS
jgi:aspartyl-tRNA synthetase